MSHNFQESDEQAKAENKKNRGKCLRILFCVAAMASVISITIADLADPSRRLSSLSDYFGEMIGGLLTIYLFSLFFFAIVRLIRGGDAPMAGLGTGIAAALLLLCTGSGNDVLLIKKNYDAVHTENTGPSQP